MMDNIKTAIEIKEIQRAKARAYEKAKEITLAIEKQAEEKYLVFTYIHPEPINALVKEILEEFGYCVCAKKDKTTRKTITEITW